ncbi:MAG: hypothetical protein IID18_00555 [Nitrospinae bacterium]|nr:hypothetical protein [Nitrospinota bacterium]
MLQRIIPFIIVFFLTAPAGASAHGGGHSDEKKSDTLLVDETPAFQDSIYAAKGGGDAELPESGTDPMSFSLSRADLFGDGADMGLMESGEPMKRSGKMEHMKEGEQHVEEATHEWVAPSSRGHGVAVGITILSVLIFGALSFMRIGEGSSGKN